MKPARKRPNRATPEHKGSTVQKPKYQLRSCAVGSYFALVYKHESEIAYWREKGFPFVVMVKS